MRGGATSAFLTVSAFYERFFVIFGDVLRSSGGGVWCEVIEPARWLLRSTAVLRALAVLPVWCMVLEPSVVSRCGLVPDDCLNALVSSDECCCCVVSGWLLSRFLFETTVFCVF